MPPQFWKKTINQFAVLFEKKHEPVIYMEY